MTELLAGLGPLGDPTHRVFGPFLVGTILVAAVLGRDKLALLFAPRIWTHRSSILDVQLMAAKLLAKAAGLLPAVGGAFGLAFAVVHALDAVVGAPGWTGPGWLLTLTYTAVLFLAWDLSKYVLHRALHGVPALWSLHQVHHSAEVLTPLTFYRTHPLESLLYGLRGALTTGVVTGVWYWAFRGAAEPLALLGVNALGFGFNLLGGNLRHSHVWLSYPGWLERWLISPAQHQLHHTPDCQRNYGTWLALWDRWFGTLDLAGEERPLTFGLRSANHAPDDLVGALLGPLVEIARTLRPAVVAAVLLVALATPAGAEEAEEDDDVEEDREQGEVVEIVDRRKGLPRVAGSAHVVDAEELERFEHNDIHRVLAPVPGVYVRGEDGYGLRPNIGLRGANSDRSAKITLLEDGILLGPAPYSAPAAYYFPMTTRMVGVEVFKGPAATRHGPQTIGGAINLQTRQLTTTPDGGFDLAIGKDWTRKLHGWAGAGGSWWSVLVEGGHLATEGFKHLPNDEPTGFAKGEAMLKARINTPRGGPVYSALELKLGWANERSNETYLGLTDADFAADPYRRYAASSQGLMEWQRAQAQLGWRLELGRDLDLRVTGYYHHFDRSWRKLNRFYDPFAPDIADVLANPEAGVASVYAGVLRGDIDSPDDSAALMIGTNHRVFHSGGVQAVGHWRARWKKLTSELEVGVRVHADSIDRLHTEDAYRMADGRLERAEDLPSEVEKNNHHEALAFAAHIHEDLGIGPVRFLPGLRLEVVRSAAEDRESGVDTTATRAVVLPGLGVHVQPTPWLSVLGGVHRGYSPVSPGQSKETEPETSWAYELGARVGHRGFRAEAIGFFNDYDNLTAQCTGSSGCDAPDQDSQYDAGRVYVYGAEVVVGQTIHLPAQLQLKGSLSYTFTGSYFATSFDSAHAQLGGVQVGDSLPYVPEHQGSARLGLMHPRFSVEAVFSGQTGMRDAAGQGELADVDVPGHWVLDLAADVNLWGPVSVYTTLNNVTNNAYLVSRRPFGTRPGRPFHMMVGVKVRGLPVPGGLLPKR